MNFHISQITSRYNSDRLKNLVYQIKCADCELTYVGKMSESLNDAKNFITEVTKGYAGLFFIIY